MSREKFENRDNFAAGIVLFNPDFERLTHNLENLSKQTRTIILYNNGTNTDEVLEWNKEKRLNIYIVGDGSNKGIATALNGIMEKSAELGFEWVLTLDQDSIVPLNMLATFQKVMKNDNVAIICPQNIDSRRKYMKVVTEPEMEYVKMCDTSGSCTRISVWKELGKFDDWLFIDLVDNDFCKRVNLKGYKIVRVNSVVMDHQYGNIEPRSRLVEKFFLGLGRILHSTNIQKLSFKRKVNPMRVYYENRNILYLNKKYSRYKGIGYSNHHCKTYLGFFLTFSVYSWIVSDKKKETYCAIRNGIKDGKAVLVQPWII